MHDEKTKELVRKLTTMICETIANFTCNEIKNEIDKEKTEINKGRVNEKDIQNILHILMSSLISSFHISLSSISQHTSFEGVIKFFIEENKEFLKKFTLDITNENKKPVH